MKSIRLRIEQIDATTAQAYKDINETFRAILHETGNNKRIFTKVWRTFPDGSAWIVPDGEHKGSIITGLAYDTRLGKAYLMRNATGKESKNDKTFIAVDSLPLHLLASLLRCIENLDFSAAPAPVPAPSPEVSEHLDNEKETTESGATEGGTEAPAAAAEEQNSEDGSQEERIEFTGKPIEPSENIF